MSVHIHPAAGLACLCLIVCSRGDVLAAFALALVLHELGHLLTARLAHQPVTRIELTPFGAMMALPGVEHAAAVTQGAIYAAGPLVNLFAAALSGVLMYVCGVSGFLVYFLAANIMLLAFNLLPILPMDGGRLLLLVLSHFLGRTRAHKYLCALGALCGLGWLGLAGYLAITGQSVNLMMGFSGLYLLYCVHREYRAGSAYIISRLTAPPAAGPLAVRTLAVPPSARLRDAVSLLTAHQALHVFVRREGAPFDVWEPDILRQYLIDPEARFEALAPR